MLREEVWGVLGVGTGTTEFKPVYAVEASLGPGGFPGAQAPWEEQEQERLCKTESPGKTAGFAFRETLQGAAPNPSTHQLCHLG